MAVLRGGPSYSYDTSLKTGEHVLSTLRDIPEKYEPLDIFISRDGEWHHGGLAQEPHRALQYADVAWNALHGSYGEDGQVAKLLEGMRIPFTGSRAVPSAMAMNKDMSKRFYRGHLLLAPEAELVTEDSLDEDHLINIFRNYLPPIVVKPAHTNGSVGLSLAHSFSELKEAIKKAFSHSPRVLVEEFIRGHEAFCTVIEKAKGERLYALLPHSELKLRTEENKRIEEMAKLAHEALGLRHYSSSDFIVTPKKKIYILETSVSPAFHDDSLMHRSLRATGWQSRDFVDHVLTLAL